ncbi:cupredoxin domain-containing protein [Roseicella aerolata]|uniref:Biphenyl 2,3-dioxygenase n=1 Tax=Roseicella aerolata TaxID=2883479 RepID=A0A9X1L9C2_9PROT|nr:hypothetical protein [Roseicella aerolata]MCB4820943.1 hypothetical protein [Roseicella aerolata]
MQDPGRRGIAGLIAAMAVAGTAWAAGDLSRQAPIEVVVDLGTAETPLAFSPATLRFETGKLYKLVLRNRSTEPHYFTSDNFAASVWTRKVQLTQRSADGREAVLAEIKGGIREIEVYPGHSAEWWLVPVQAGRFTDLRCGIRMADGKTHAEHGMRGEIVIE